MAAAVTAATFVASGLFLAGLAAKERDNRFCVACHLHEEKSERLSARAPTDLAGAHYRKDRDVGCIACHGGADLPMRLRVWAVAGFDTVKFLAGAYREPDRMRLPLRDAECRQCHTPILKASEPSPASRQAVPAPRPRIAPSPDVEAEAYLAPPPDAVAASTSYHAIREHNAVKVACVACHTTHTIDGDPAGRFIGKDRVGRICRDCHPQL